MRCDRNNYRLNAILKIDYNIAGALPRLYYEISNSGHAEIHGDSPCMEGNLYSVSLPSPRYIFLALFCQFEFPFCIHTKISFSLNIAFTALGTLPSLCPFLFFAARLELLTHDI